MFLTDTVSSFPEGSQVVTKEKLGRGHGSEKQLFWVPFYIILVKKSQYRVLSPMGHLPVVCSQDHAVRFIKTGVKVQPIGKWCNWVCGKALHLPVAYRSLKGMSSLWQVQWLHRAVAWSPQLLKDRITFIWCWRTELLTWIGGLQDSGLSTKCESDTSV